MLGAAFAVLLLAMLPAAAQAVEQKLVAGDGAGLDQLGASVAVDGDTAVVGAPGDNTGKGAVYVFELAGATWAQTAKLTASDGVSGSLEPGDGLGTSVAIEGDTIVAGASGDDSGANDRQGSVYTFARTGPANRSQTAKLTASDGDAFDFLGTSVAIDGDTIVAGASGASATQGSAYTFARSGPANRSQTAKLTASDGVASDFLGFSVAIDGDTIVAGTPVDDIGANTDQGSAYTFTRTGPATRSESAKLTTADGGIGDNLGWSVAVDGDTIAAGARFDDVGANSFQGSAYTFARTGPAARTETAKLTASDAAPGDGLGFSVAIDGDTIVAGAPIDNVGANSDQGSAYIFARSGPAARTETAKLTAADGAASDELGQAVAVDGDTVVAGAPSDDLGANADQGSASVFFPTADLALAKTASTGTVTAGEEITYTLSVKNSGPDAATAVRASDDLPVAVGFTSASAGCTNVAGTVTCEFGALAAGATESAEIVVIANQPGTVVNTATVDGAEADPAPANDEDSAATLVQPVADPPGGDRPGDDDPPGDDSVPCPEGTSATVVCSENSNGRTVFQGSGEAETFVGTNGADKMLGGGGKDKLRARNGRDTLKGQGGRDKLNGGKGRDKLSGGGGNDRINSKGQKREKVSCGSGKRDTVKGARGDKVKRNCERVRR